MRDGGNKPGDRNWHQRSVRCLASNRVLDAPAPSPVLEKESRHASLEPIDPAVRAKCGSVRIDVGAILSTLAVAGCTAFDMGGSKTSNAFNITAMAARTWCVSMTFSCPLPA